MIFIFSKKYLLLCSVLLMVLISCIDTPEFSEIPALKFEQINVIRDTRGIEKTVKISLSFTDGDGDLGYPSDQSAEPDIFITKFRKVKGEFIEMKLDTTPYADTNSIKIPYHFRLPEGISKVGTKRQVEGFLDVFDKFAYDTDIRVNDTLLYEVEIQDLAKHRSNRIRTTPVVIHH